LKYSVIAGRTCSPKATAHTFDSESNKPESRNSQSSSTWLEAVLSNQFKKWKSFGKQFKTISKQEESSYLRL
jgi:hypothetical protein